MIDQLSIAFAKQAISFIQIKANLVEKFDFRNR